MPIMKNIVDTIRVEITRNESGAGETMFPDQFAPGLNSGQAGVPPMQCAGARRYLGSQWSEPLENIASVPPKAGHVTSVRVDPAGFHQYLSNDENRLLPNRAAGSFAHVSPLGSGPVCAEWGDDSVGKVAFHPPVQAKVKR